MQQTQSHEDLPAALVPLNLPPQQVRLRRGAESVEIYDPQRGKWLVVTPEEWVRQHFTAWLRDCRGYPAAMMANEVSLRLNGTLRRSDTVIYDRSLRPIAVAEYKAPGINITQRVFDQIARYNIVLGARVLMVSNGLCHYCCRYNGSSYTFLPEIPPYDEI